MNKGVGYGVAVLGILVMAVSFQIINLEIAVLDGISRLYISGAGVILVAIGVALALKGTGRSRGEDNYEEVPIYEGKGKNRRIVGYQRK